MDIYPDAVRALARAGVDAEHFRLGYSGFWDRWDRDESGERPVDVLHLGAVNARRLRALAGFAGTLWPHRTRLLIPPEKPKTRERADFLLGEAKWECLRSAKILLNLHRQESAYFEWVRVLEGISNGCVLVSEHSPDCAPLVPGEHFVAGRSRIWRCSPTICCGTRSGWRRCASRPTTTYVRSCRCGPPPSG